MDAMEYPGNNARLLFIEFSSALNTINLEIPINKLLDLYLPAPTCTGIKDFLTNRPQSVKLRSHLSSSLILSTGSPQGCVLSPLLYALYTYDCTTSHPSNSIIKFADNTTVVGVITRGDETANREKVQQLAVWCLAKNVLQNTTKTKEVIIDFRRIRVDHAPLHINGDYVERVSPFEFLEVYISEEPT